MIAFTLEYLAVLGGIAAWTLLMVGVAYLSEH